MAFDTEIATLTVFMEASGEGPDGIQAVAYVIVNRWKSGKFGTTIAAVCLKPLQFSCWNTSDSNRMRAAIIADDDPVLQQCQAAVIDAMAHTAPDPTDGALYYFADTIQTPHWVSALNFTARIGHQRFYK